MKVVVPAAQVNVRLVGVNILKEVVGEYVPAGRLTLASIWKIAGAIADELASVRIPL